MKQDYEIKLICKKQAAELLLKYHYLKDISRGFKSGFNFGLFNKNELLGICVFTGFPVPELVKGMFGLDRSDQKGMFELSRLCIHPETQKEEYNITSWFVSRCINKLKKETEVRCILSYADSEYHSGTIYKACNFKYYGLSNPKKDFWILQNDGTFIKHSRGKTKGVPGEWRHRSQKHRFVLLFDDKLKIKWTI